MSECMVLSFGEPILPVLRSDIKGAFTGSIPLPFFPPWTLMYCLELWQLFWDHEKEPQDEGSEAVTGKELRSLMIVKLPYQPKPPLD